MARTSTILGAVAVGAALLSAGPAALAAESDAHAAPGKLICYPPGETREQIKAHRLLEPFAVLKSAQTQFKAEALSARLCHIGDEFVYEISLLHRDGRYVHAIVNAATGKFIEWRHGREPVSKT